MPPDARPWFFVSYSHIDAHDSHVKTFCERLNAEVLSMVEDEGPKVGFSDLQLNVGDDWAPELRHALQETRTLVCLYSPHYFKSEFCGKEFKIFHDRIQKVFPHKEENGECSPLILPVLLVREEFINLHPSVRHIHYKGDFPREYLSEGLRQILQRPMRPPIGEDLSAKFIDYFATTLVRNAKQHPLEPGAVARFSAVDSAFHSGAVGGVAPAQDGADEPAVAQFVFVAGNRDELAELRTELGPYGAGRGGEWRPYDSEGEDVRTIAERAAGLQKLDSEVLPLTPDLVELLHKAEDKRRITALVVDPWSVQLQSYRELMRKFDDAQDLRASAVLVPWNEGDSETAVMSKQLEATLHDVFNNFIYNRPYYFRNRIPDADALTHELSIVFNLHLKRQMSARPAVGKKMLTMPTLGAKDEAASILRSGLAQGLRIPAAAGLAVSRQLLNPGVL